MGDVAYAVLQAADTGYVITGGTSISGNNDFYLIRIDKYGDTLWTKRYGGGGSDIGYNIITESATKDYVIAGTTNSFGAGGGDIFLIRTDSFGDTSWTKTYGGGGDEFVRGIISTSDNNYILIGQTPSFGAGLNDFYVLKIDDSTGDTIWTMTYGGTDGEGVTSIYESLNDGYVLLGGTISFGTSGSLIIKIDNNGNVIWSKILKTSNGGGGSIVFETTVTLKVTVLEPDFVTVNPGARVGIHLRIAPFTEFMNLVTDSNGEVESTHNYSADVEVFIRIRDEAFVYLKVPATITSSGILQTVAAADDSQFTPT